MTTNQTIDGVPLLPCPLCRGKVRAPKCKAAGHACVTWTISCNCGVSYESDDEQGTIRGWNRRATPCSEAQDPPAGATHCQKDKKCPSTGGIQYYRHAENSRWYYWPEGLEQWSPLACKPTGDVEPIIVESPVAWISPEALSQIEAAAKTTWPSLAPICSHQSNVDGLSVGLYRKQPAPVAVVLPARPRADEEEYERMTDYEKGLLHGGIELWDKIDEAIRLAAKSR